MDILGHLNEKVQIVSGDSYFGGEDMVKQVVETSPISLPEDYIAFLMAISGEGSGLEFEVTAGDDTLSLWIFSAQQAMQKYEEYKVYSAPTYDDIIDRVWLIGNDLGDLLYFYGNGKDGFGLYVAEDGSWCFEEANKIADTLTDFLVNGVGIDTAFRNQY